MFERRRRRMKTGWVAAMCVWGGLSLLSLTLTWPGAAAGADAPVEVKGNTGDESFGKVHSLNNTANHAKFKELQAEFKSGPEVTKACLSCHTEAASQLHKTLHWTWRSPSAAPEAKLGKGGLVVNNFCISQLSNEPRCTSCHIGYGWKDKNFDFTAQERVDCLVCHEQTGTYKKFPTKAGLTVDEPTEFGGKTWMPPNGTRWPSPWGARRARIAANATFSAGAARG